MRELSSIIFKMTGSKLTLYRNDEGAEHRFTVKSDFDDFAATDDNPFAAQRAVKDHIEETHTKSVKDA